MSSEPERQSFQLQATPESRNTWELMVKLGNPLVIIAIAAFILNFFSFSLNGDAAPPRSESPWFLPIAAFCVLTFAAGFASYVIGRIGMCFAR